MEDEEIRALIRDAVSSAMRDIPLGDIDFVMVDDMVNAESGRQEFEGEGMDLGGSGMCGAFAFEGGKIKVGGIYRARTFMRIEGIDVPDDFTGYAYVEVGMGSTGLNVLTLSETVPEMSDEVAIMMLYKFKDGSVEEDYRGSPHVQMWE